MNSQGQAKRQVDKVILPKAVNDPILGLVVHSQTGLDNKDYIQDMSEEGYACERLPDSYDIKDYLRSLLGSWRSRRLGTSFEGVPADYLPDTPFGLSMLHLGEYYDARTHREHAEPVVVILGDTVDDFCLYYSMSRIHENVRWVPLTWLRSHNATLRRNTDRWQRGEEPIHYSTEQRLAPTLVGIVFELIDYGHSGKRIQLTSASLSRPQLTAFRRHLAQASVDPQRFEAKVDCVAAESLSTTCVMRVFEQDNYINERSMEFRGRQSVGRFDTPRPKNFGDVRPGDHYWVTSILIEAYQPPASPTLGPKIVNIHNSTTETRIASDGIAFHSPNPMIFSRDMDAVIVRPRIELPDVMEMLGSYFEPLGITIRYSDKGNYFMDALRRFGGLEAAGRFIKRAATRRILDKYMRTSHTADGSVIYLDNDQRAYLNLAAFSSSLGDRNRGADLIDELVRGEVLQRGYIFQCDRCRLVSWYGLESLTTEFTCTRCSFRQQYTRRHWRNPAVPHWYYRLAETVYQFYCHHSHLTAQVLYKLKSESMRAFHYAPEIDLLDFPGPGEKREMDVACVVDGKVILGECKTGSLRPRDAEKFQMLVGRATAKPARIVFATTERVPDAFKRRIKLLPGAEVFPRNALYDGTLRAQPATRRRGG